MSMATVHQISCVSKKNLDGWFEIIENYQSLLHYFKGRLYSGVSQPDVMAEDLAQETALKAYSHVETNGQHYVHQKLRSWIFHEAGFVASNYLKSLDNIREVDSDIDAEKFAGELQKQKATRLERLLMAR